MGLTDTNPGQRPGFIGYGRFCRLKACLICRDFPQARPPPGLRLTHRSLTSEAIEFIALKRVGHDELIVGNSWHARNVRPDVGRIEIGFSLELEGSIIGAPGQYHVVSRVDD